MQGIFFKNERNFLSYKTQEVSIDTLAAISDGGLGPPQSINGYFLCFVTEEIPYIFKGNSLHF